jgi:steroid 5-alpha reductase family enzyme
MLAATLCMTINFLAWIPASVWRTERYYDLTGALTCLCMMAAVLYVERGTVGFRGGLVALCVCIWAVRLGRFLFRRIVRDGGVDRRFDGLREHPDRFLIPWTLQGMWVTLNTLAAVVIISNHDASQALGLADAIGFGLWGVGFAIEVIADRQKTVFRADPANHDAFITTGLWARSRHPNYFGEIMLWSGVFIVGTPHYVGWQWLVVISPLFCAFLLTRVSGIPMVETRSNARWGHLEAYQAYLAKTPVLIPRLWP